MFCHYCGKQIKDNAAFCPYCGKNTATNKKSETSAPKSPKKKRKAPLILLLIILLLMLAGVTVKFLFIDSLQESNESLSNNVTTLATLDKGFSDIPIKDEDSAIEAVRNCSEQLGLENALTELSCHTTSSVDNEIYYRLQQNYHGIPVYGRYVIVVASVAGESLNLISDVEDIPDDISLNAQITDQQAANSIHEYAIHNWGAVYDEMTISELSDDSLVIYNQNTEARLAYCLNIINGSYYEVIIDAQTGEILDCIETISDSSSLGTNVDETITFPVTYDSEANEYIIEDTERQIFIFNLGKYNSKKDGWWGKKEYVTSSGDSVFGNTDAEQKQDPEKAISLISLLGEIIDYYKNTFEQETPYGAVFAFYNDGYSWGRNALGGSLPCTTDDGSSVTYGFLSVGHALTCQETDILTHEYTHIVAREHDASTGSGKEAGAIGEGLADLFACFYTSDWDIDLTTVGGSHRNAISPSKYKYPEKITDANKSGEDYSHGYATVISHAAYLMSESECFSTDELALLWYKTMIRLPSNCTYNNLRVCMEQAAITSNYTDQQKKIIAEVFEQVGITDTNTLKYGNNIELSVFDKQGNLYDDYNIKITGKTSGGFFGIGSKSYSTEIEPQTADPVSISLEDGTYTITVTDCASENTSEYAVKIKSSYSGTNLYIQDFGADYTVSPGATFIVLDTAGNEFSNYSASAQYEENTQELKDSQINLPEKNYYTVLLSNKQGNITYYDLFTLRVKENTATSITYQSRFDPENLISIESLAGIWTLDTQKTNAFNDTSLSNYFGSGIHQGYELALEENGAASWYIGIGNGGKGTYTFTNSEGRLEYTDYEDNSEKTVTLFATEENGINYILMEYDDYTLFWTQTENSMPDNKTLSQVNYYDSTGTLIYYDSYAYYDNGLLCSTTLHSVNYMPNGSSYIGTEYTFLYLYDENWNLTDTVLDALTISEWYNESTGEIILDYEYDANGNSSKVCIYPKTESIEQEKFGVDASKTEEIYGNASIITTDLSGEWATAYLNEIFAGEEPTDMTSCRLIYVDNNSIPELWIDYGYGYAGAEVYTKSNDGTDSISISQGGAEWIENENLLLTSGGHMDVYYDEVYKIEDGKFVLLGAGDYGAIDNSNVQYDEQDNPIYDYYWNDSTLSKDEYEQNLNNIFNRTRATNIYQNIYTYDQCKLLLRSLSSNATTSTSEESDAKSEQLAPSDAEVFGEHHYKFFTLDSVNTWEDAKAYCESLGGHLAIITSSEENNFLYQLMVDAGYTNAYFGLTDSYDEGNWIWMDGSEAIYTNWHSGEPNSENPSEDYGMFYWKYTDGTWNDGDFGKRTNKGGTTFICEWNN